MFSISSEEKANRSRDRVSEPKTAEEGGSWRMKWKSFQEGNSKIKIQNRNKVDAVKVVLQSGSGVGRWTPGDELMN